MAIEEQKIEGSGHLEKDGKGRHKDCPLVEVPEPHGRLIDADILMRDINKYHVSDGKFQHWIAEGTERAERKRCSRHKCR
jgi:hypothetical protein